MQKKEARKTTVRKRNWKFVFYPESAPKNWKEIIENWGVPALVSPLHDKDTDENGELKKPHYHVLLTYDGGRTQEEIIGLCKMLGVSYAIGNYNEEDKYGESRSRKRDERYWCHLDSPNKYRYDPADLLCLNGYEPKYLQEEYEYDGITAIHELCEMNGIIYYADLANEIVTNHRELLGTLLRYPAHFNNFCYSRLKLAKAGNVSYVKSRRKVGKYAYES